MSNMIISFIPIAVGSAVGFQCFNAALNFDFVPPPLGKYAGVDRHRWRNAATSLVNSTIIAAITVYCLFHHSDLWSDPMTYYSVPGDVCFAVISGYLIYDTYDLMAHSNLFKVWSVVLHHVIMSFVFFIMSVEQLGMGFLIIGLLCEISAIFLHSRLLLLMYGFSKQSLLYSVHKIFNLVTFVLLRLAPIMYALYVSVIRQWPLYLAVTLPLLTTTIIVINCILLWRVLCSDFRKNNGRDNHIGLMDN